MRSKIQTTNNEPDDEYIVERVKLGDIEAFSMLYDRYARLVFSIGFRILRNREEAKDLVQDIFFLLFKGKVQLYNKKEKGSWISWLTHISYTRAFNRKEYLTSRKYYVFEQIDVLLDWRGTDDFEGEIANKEQVERIKVTFSELTEIQKKTLQMVIFEGLTFQEVSEILLETHGNIRNHYYRAIKKLRETSKAAQVLHG